MAKAIALIRVSTTNQHTQEQKQEVINELTKEGYTDIEIIEGVGESGVKLSIEERQTTQRMVDLIEGGDVATVCCWELSRLSRRATDLMKLRDYFIEHHIQLIVLKPYFRLFDYDGKVSQMSNMAFALFSSMAENEAISFKERTARGRIGKASEGKRIGAFNVGYRADENNKLVIDENVAPIIRKVFEMYASGEHSLTTITQELIDCGDIETLGYSENFNTVKNWVSNVLNKKALKGDFSDTIYRGLEPIVSPELWDKCNDILHNRHIPKSKVKEVVYGRGLVRNEEGFLLTPHICDNTYRLVRPDYELYINANAVDSILLHYATIYYEAHKDTDLNKRIEEVSKKMDEVSRKLAKAKKEVEKTYQKDDKVEERLIMGGRLTEEMAEKLHRTIADERNELNEKIYSYETQLTNLEGESTALYWGLENEVKPTSHEERYEFIKKAIKGVVVSKSNGVTYFTITFADNSVSKCEFTCSGGWLKLFVNGEQTKIEWLKRFKRK